MKINLEIPAELITENDKSVDYSFIKGKTIVALCGYARSGKDTLGRLMVERLGFKRASFGDMLKKDLDEYMRPQVHKDLIDKNESIAFEDVNFLNPKSIKIKELLRPYMIWFGEYMKEKNGIHHWTNRVFSQLGDSKKIVITDVRRINEIEIFKMNSETRKQRINNKHAVGIQSNKVEEEVYLNDFETLLIHVNQFGLEDSDKLTLDAIRVAHEQWLFNHIVYVDSRIPDTNDYRDKHMLFHLHELINKFPNYFV